MILLSLVWEILVVLFWVVVGCAAVCGIITVFSEEKLRPWGVAALLCIIVFVVINGS